MSIQKSYLEELTDTLSEQIEVLNLYKVKLEMLKCFYEAQNTTIEIVENKLEYLKTKKEISVLEKVIKEKTNYFESYSIIFAQKYADMSKDFDTVLDKARKKKDSNLTSMLKSVNWDVININKEAKLNLYNELKKSV
jgi:hypothetical protein